MAISWNSELASGHNPFWIRDSALSGVGLRVGDTVAVDTRADAVDGDLVVAEVELDGDSVRVARRFLTRGDVVRLEAVGADVEPLEVAASDLIVMGVIVGRVRFDGDHATEEPLV